MRRSKPWQKGRTSEKRQKVVLLLHEKDGAWNDRISIFFRWINGEVVKQHRYFKLSRFRRVGVEDLLTSSLVSLSTPALRRTSRVAGLPNFAARRYAVEPST